MKLLDLVEITLAEKIISIGISIIIFLVVLFLNSIFIKTLKVKIIIFMGVCIRWLIILCDNFYKVVSFSGADSIAFNNAGIGHLENSTNILFLDFPFIKIYVGPIYKTLGFASPLVVQSINLLLYWLTNFILYKFLTKKSFNKKIIFRIFILFNISIVSALLSVSFLREGLMIFFLTLGIVNFLEWTNSYSRKEIMIFCLSIGMASYLHSGVIFIIFMPIIYQILKVKKIKKIIITLCATVLAIFIFPNIMKLEYVNRGLNLRQTLLSQQKSIGVGSSYISEARTNFDLLLQAPIRYIYFLFSPLPHQVRGVVDLSVFLINSTIYIYLNYKVIIFYLKERKNKKFLCEKVLIYMYIIINFIYALGTTTVGTALRHRDKFYTLLLILYFLIISKKGEKND